MISPQTLAAIRFGYGLPLPAGAVVEPVAMLRGLQAPDQMASRFPGVTTAQAMALVREFEIALKARRRSETKATQADVRAALRDVELTAEQGARATIARAIASPDGLRERLVQFWSDHFTVARRASQFHTLPSAFADEAIRPNLAGPFAAMLTAAALHPGMLKYLDQASSVGPGSRAGQRDKRGLNENLAREILELHTLGVGAGYDQTDVREFAELLTGLGVDAEGFRFYPQRAEPGAETVLEQSYGGPGPADLAPIRAVLADLAVRPETARHISGKLVTHFLSDTPDPADIAALQSVWLDSGGDLGAVTGALLALPAAWSPDRQKIRQPFDLVVAGLRALGVTPEAVVAMDVQPFRKLVLMPLASMGQPWQSPRGPDGWPESAEDWITPQGLGARLAWAMTAPAGLVRPLPDPRALVASALGDAASEALVISAGRAENRRDGVGLILASPDFNRR